MCHLLLSALFYVFVIFIQYSFKLCHIITLFVVVQFQIDLFHCFKILLTTFIGGKILKRCIDKFGAYLW